MPLALSVPFIFLHVNTLRTSDANLRLLCFCVTTVKDGLRKIAF
jgi:hypothetical protein